MVVQASRAASVADFVPGSQLAASKRSGSGWCGRCVRCSGWCGQCRAGPGLQPVASKQSGVRSGTDGGVARRSAGGVSRTRPNVLVRQLSLAAARCDCGCTAIVVTKAGIIDIHISGRLNYEQNNDTKRSGVSRWQLRRPFCTPESSKRGRFRTCPRDTRRTGSLGRLVRMRPPGPVQSQVENVPPGWTGPRASSE